MRGPEAGGRGAGALYAANDRSAPTGAVGLVAAATSAGSSTGLFGRAVVGERFVVFVATGRDNGSRSRGDGSPRGEGGGGWFDGGPAVGALALSTTATGIATGTGTVIATTLGSAGSECEAKLPSFPVKGHGVGRVTGAVGAAVGGVYLLGAPSSPSSPVSPNANE